ncbi:MAG TPA: CaiB/BaiF CoA-transferase family protein [Acidimicrobiia bacterium]|nr:CaiB/BaiF CoA-transferase family protein [Acidimicrobiia bacterium]
MVDPTDDVVRRGPLAGVRVVELAGIGPVPFAGMVLADLGAEVVRVDRPDPGPIAAISASDPTSRGKSSIVVDLKRAPGVEVVLRLAGASDILIEGHRPGVAERLGLGPEECSARNPALIYGRMTGWGQTGPLATTAGHDINYLAVSGNLAAIGPADRPLPPLNLVADYGGGAMLLLVGILAALTDARSSGEGQVVDAAMVDGSALLASVFRGLLGSGSWIEQRESNLLDGGAPFYRTYRTRDDGFVAVGALEPQFFAAFLTGLGLDPADVGDQYDRSRWESMSARFAAEFASRSRAEWVDRFSGTDACVSPVLTFSESLTDPHLAARRTFLEIDGIFQPAPAPRFSRTPAPIPARERLSSTDESMAEVNRILGTLGYSEAEVGMLRKERAVR